MPGVRRWGGATGVIVAFLFTEIVIPASPEVRGIICPF